MEVLKLKVSQWLPMLALVQKVFFLDHHQWSLVIKHPTTIHPDYTQVRVKSREPLPTMPSVGVRAAVRAATSGRLGPRLSNVRLQPQRGCCSQEPLASQPRLHSEPSRKPLQTERKALPPPKESTGAFLGSQARVSGMFKRSSWSSHTARAHCGNQTTHERDHQNCDPKGQPLPLQTPRAGNKQRERKASASRLSPRLLPHKHLGLLSSKE